MTVGEAVFLGIIQGLTEFLPVSSSGHLVLFSQLLQVQDPSLLFEIVVHGGTLAAVFFCLREEVLLLIKSFFKILLRPHQAARLIQTDAGCRLLFNLILATLPVVVAALVWQELIERVFQSSVFVGFMLLVTGTVLFWSDQPRLGRKKPGGLSSRDSLIIGLGQAVAILPGVSRSGTTIAAGLALGLDRVNAARFSFLLSIPAILGALLFSLGGLAQEGASLAAGPLWAGFLASALTGSVAIRILLNLIKQGRLILFSYYTWALGLLVIFWSFF